jgi:hypothetical protein
VVVVVVVVLKQAATVEGGLESLRLADSVHYIVQVIDPIQERKLTQRREWIALSGNKVFND